MRRLERITFGKVDLSQNDILQKKDMRNIRGRAGYCDVECGDTGKRHWAYCANSLDDCYDQIADFCPNGWFGSCEWLK